MRGAIGTVAGGGGVRGRNVSGRWVAGGSETARHGVPARSGAALPAVSVRAGRRQRTRAVWTSPHRPDRPSLFGRRHSGRVSSWLFVCRQACMVGDPTGGESGEPVVAGKPAPLPPPVVHEPVRSGGRWQLGWVRSDKKTRAIGVPDAEGRRFGTIGRFFRLPLQKLRNAAI